MKSLRGIKKFLKSKSFVLLILIAIMSVVFSILSKGAFIMPFNIRSIIRASFVSIFLTVGAVYLLICGYIDLSTSMVGNFGGVFVAILMNRLGVPWVLAIFAVLVASAFFGLVNAFLVSRLKFVPFIATMAMSYIVQGLMLIMEPGRGEPIKNKFTSFIGTYQIGGVFPLTMLIALLVMLVYGIILAKTTFGKSIYLIGGNRVAAMYCGLSTKKIVYTLFINNAVLGGLGGVLLAFCNKVGAPEAIQGATFTGITGAILGGVSFLGGSGGMGGAFIGILLLNGFANGMTVIGMQQYWQTLANGALLLLALSFDYVSLRRQGKLKQ